MSGAKPLPGTAMAVSEVSERDALYPMLLMMTGSWGVSKSQHRPPRDQNGTLVTLALRHDRLNAEQYEALGRFRLNQFLGWGWYDPQAASVRDARLDPAFAALPPNTIHVLSGTREGRLLGYCCIEGAAWLPGQPRGSIASFGAPHRLFTLGDSERPLLPTEIEETGPRLFATLPALRNVSVKRVREPSTLLGNFAIPGPLTAAAATDAFCLAAEIVMSPSLGLEVLIGHGDLDMRKMMASLGIPALYAPLAPAARVQPGDYWLHDVELPGRFWPFVIPIADLRAHAGHLARLANALTGSTRDHRRELVTLRRNTPLRLPSTLLASAAVSTELWTTDPYYDTVAAEEAKRQLNRITGS